MSVEQSTPKVILNKRRHMYYSVVYIVCSTAMSRIRETPQNQMCYQVNSSQPGAGEEGRCEPVRGAPESSYYPCLARAIQIRKHVFLPVHLPHIFADNSQHWTGAFSSLGVLAHCLEFYPRLMILHEITSWAACFEPRRDACLE